MKQLIIKLIKKDLLYLIRRLVHNKFRVLSKLVKSDRQRLNSLEQKVKVLERRIQVLEGKEKIRQLGGIK